MLLSVAISFMTMACSSEQCIVVSNVPEFQWHRDSARYLVFENDDSLSKRTVALVVRYNTQKISKQQIRVALEFQSPQNELYRDTLNCALQCESSSAFGTQQPRYQDQLYKFIEGAVLKYRGKYIVKINHFDEEYCEGIAAVGISIN